MAHTDCRFTYGLGDVARRLGVDHRPRRWQLRYLTRLIDGQGFPAPLPTLVGERLIEFAHGASRWMRDPVDQWFDDRHGDDDAPIGGAMAMRAGQRDMDDAAGRIAEQMARRWGGGAVHQGGRL